MIIFVNKFQRSEMLTKVLKEQGMFCICTHGQLEQSERIQRFEGFKNNQYRILVSTDLMGRGIDVERVDIVINFDMPDSCETYLHRVGRSGRFGTKGMAISFISTGDDKKILEKVQEKYGKKITELPKEIDASKYQN